MLEELEKEEKVSQKEYLKKIHYEYQKYLFDIQYNYIKEDNLLEDYRYQIWYDKVLK